MESTVEEIGDLENELALMRAVLQSLDESHCSRPDALQQRHETLEVIKGLERSLAALRGDQSGLNGLNGGGLSNHAFPLGQGITSPPPPPAQLDGSHFSRPNSIPSSPPQFGRPAFSLPNRPRDPPSYNPTRMAPTRKRPFDDDDEDSIGLGSSKRATVNRNPSAFESHPASTRENSEDSVDDNDLLDILGLGGQDMKELQEEQRRAERWLEERKEQERRDEEFARSLMNHDEAPSSSASTRAPPNPAPRLAQPFGGHEYFPPPTPQSTSIHPLFQRRLPEPPRHTPEVDTNSPFSGPSFQSVRIPSDSDDSDIAEITPREFQFNAGGHPAFPPAMYIPAAHNTGYGFPNGAGPYTHGAAPGDPTAISRLWNQVPSVSPYLRQTRDRIMQTSEVAGSMFSHGPLGNVFNGLTDNEINESLSAGSLRDLYDSGADPQQLNADIKQLLETIRPDTEIAKENREGTPVGLNYTLLDHQKLGLAWMKSKEECDQKGGILADDMGLGKTIQAISLLVSRPSTDPDRKTTLIIAPVALMKQWKREIEKVLRPGHHLQVFVLHGEKRATSFRELKKYDVVLTTFGKLAAELKRLDEYDQLLKSGAEEPTLASKYLKALPCLGPNSKWYRVIIDEAQCIKNRTAKTSIACCRLDATYRWCMTGTPMMNTVLELHSLLKFLRNRPYGGLEPFQKDFGRPLKSNSQHAQDRAMAQLRVLLKAVLLRRTKDSKIDGKPILNLPRRVSEKVHAAFSEDELALYKSLESQTQIQFNRYLEAGTVGRNYSNILVLLLRLRQACCHPHLIQDFSVKLNETTEGVDFIANAKEFSEEVVIRLRDNENLECPICIDAVENPVIFFPCGHGTCAECFSRISDPALSLQQGVDGAMSVKCPNCRGVVDPKKITDHVSFRKVHFPEETGGVPGLEDLFPAIEENEVDDDDSDDSDEGRGTLSDFIVSDNDDDSNHAKTINKKDKGKGKAKEKPKKTLAELKKEAAKNKASKRRYMRRLEKTWVTSAKIEKTMEILRDVSQREGNEKTIVFSQFTSLLDLLEVPIAREGYGYRRYDGSMKPMDRDASVLDFTDDSNCNVMLVSLKAGNAGLNLIAANHVVIFDPFWNPYVEEQAIDRAHRFGQMREVNVHRILVPETVEDRIIELQDKKRALIEGALDENASQSIARLSTRELGYLFGINNR